MTASQNNNSVSSYIEYDKSMLDEGNSIFIGGKTLVISYQEKDYFSNDSHNLALYFKNEEYRTKEIQLYMVSALYKSLKPLYSWGNSISKQKIQNDFVSLPTLNNELAFSYMENYIKALEAYLTVTNLRDYHLTKNDEKVLDKFEKLSDTKSRGVGGIPTFSSYNDNLVSEYSSRTTFKERRPDKRRLAFCDGWYDQYRCCSKYWK
nr:hypothetical protein [Streptococcus mitis]